MSRPSNQSQQDPCFQLGNRAAHEKRLQSCCIRDHLSLIGQTLRSQFGIRLDLLSAKVMLLAVRAC